LRSGGCAGLAVLALACLLSSGCTSFLEYLRNGFKVGPNYHKPPAPVAPAWIDVADKRVRSDADDLSQWWTVFNDPVLDNLVAFAYQQNLSLRAAGFRVLEARAQLGIDIGSLLPQTQAATGDFKWNALSQQTANNFLQANIPGVPPFKRWYGQWDLGFNLSWRLDF
jgi:outer membrane protein TolC